MMGGDETCEYGIELALIHRLAVRHFYDEEVAEASFEHIRVAVLGEVLDALDCGCDIVTPRQCQLRPCIGQLESCHGATGGNTAERKNGCNKA